MSPHEVLPEVYPPQEGGRRATGEYAGLRALAYSLNLIRPPCPQEADKLGSFFSVRAGNVLFLKRDPHGRTLSCFKNLK